MFKSANDYLTERNNLVNSLSTCIDN